MVALALLGRAPRGSVALGLLAALAGLGAFAAGGLGWVSQRTRTDGATTAPGLTANDRERLQAYGYAEAVMPFEFGAGAGALPLLAGTAAFGFGLRKKRPAPR